ncbi:MAG: glycosyltransferase involved in cell wall biosynthesis [Desulforhopalus sp.]|jgi:glycosyltransferase involved in cell wall biosynthesis
MEKSRRIHILVIIKHPIGGIRSFLRDLYSQFDPEHFKLTFLLPDTSELDALRENLKATDCTFLILEQNANILVFVKTLFRVLNKSDIDVVHSNGFTAMIISVIPAFLYKKPHILTAHDTFTEKQFTKFKGMLKKVVLGVCFHFVDVIHSVSNDAQSNLLEYFPALRKKISKLIVIPNGIDTRRFLVDDREDWRKQIGLEKETFLIGFFGRFMAPKGFRYLIEAVDIISKMKKDYKFVVLAFGWGGFIREEQAEIELRGLQDYFHFLPFQENPAKAIRGIDVVAIPSLWEAGPILPMEVLVAGVPIVGTDCRGLREVLLDTPARVVSAADSKALAEAIIEEIQSPSNETMEQFRGEAIQRFNVTHQVKSLKLLIHKLVDKA